MAATTPGAARRTPARAARRFPDLPITETRRAFKTTEFLAYLGSVAAVLVAAAIVDEGNAGGLGARQAWLYVTILTVGYMVSRGVAKAGSAEWDPDKVHEDDRRFDRDREGERAAP
jgi:hypothetical protein